MDDNDQATTESITDDDRRTRQRDATINIRERQDDRQSRVDEILRTCQEARDVKALASLAALPGGFAGDEARRKACGSEERSTRAALLMVYSQGPCY